MNKKSAFIIGLLFSLVLVRSSCCYAAEVTGEQSLAGFSKMLSEYINKTDHACYPEGVDLLANVMYHENHSNGEKVMYYTGAVVMNRVKKGYANGTIKSVLYAKNQYATTSEFYTVGIPKDVYDIAIKILKHGTPDVPENVVYQAMFPQGSGVWKAIPASYDATDVEYFCFE